MTTTSSSDRRPELELHYANEWAALYVDGRLEHVGDAHNAEERAFKLLGVKTVDDDAFMRGQNKREGVAQTLAEVDEYRAAREARRQEAAALRERARLLLAEADELDSGPSH